MTEHKPPQGESSRLAEKTHQQEESSRMTARKPPRMKQPGENSSFKFTTEDREHILDWVRTHGVLFGATAGTTISYSTLKRKLAPVMKGKPSPRYDPEFAAQIKDAILTYKKTQIHPSDDADIRADALTQFRLMCKNGLSNIQTLEYDEDGHVIKKTYHKAGVDRWVFETIFPPKAFTEQAVITIVANMLSDVATYPFDDDKDREIVMVWLSGWMKRAKDELHKQGLSLKVIDKLGE